MILFTFSWLIEGKFKSKWALLKKDKLFIAYSCYFLIQFAGLFQSENIYEAWDKIENKMGFLLLPIVFCSTSFLNTVMRRKVMLFFSLVTTVAAIYCLAIVSIQYANTGNSMVFFYHQLVGPISHHAVYFSVYTFIVVAFLILEGGTLPLLVKNRLLYISWIIFLLFFLFLLSSKMVLFVMVFFLFYLSFGLVKKEFLRWQAGVAALFGVLLIIAIITTDNPVRRRFIDLNGNVALLKEKKYNAGDYFNGWQFRLLLWRVTYEIIRDKQAWLIGVGPSDAQKILEEKYRRLGLYTGGKNAQDRGYLQYNCHNQFLQTFLQSGIAGLLFFSGWCCMLLKRTLSGKEPVLSWSLLVIMCFFFIESVCERQYGMVLCTLIPLMYIYTARDVTNA